MKIKQERVNKRTIQYDEDTDPAARDTGESREQAAELARKQRKVEDLLREMARRLGKEEADH
ncbi:MAG: hypothetical protein KDB80_15315 [Planctomycetes bacterium]|nr:hypothetical protein [Planctomycetota bacterium]